jgi:hypothetical protein
VLPSRIIFIEISIQLNRKSTVTVCDIFDNLQYLYWTLGLGPSEPEPHHVAAPAAPKWCGSGSCSATLLILTRRCELKARAFESTCFQYEQNSSFNVKAKIVNLKKTNITNIVLLLMNQKESQKTWKYCIIFINLF